MTLKNITNIVNPFILRFEFEESLRLVKFRKNNLEISMKFDSYFKLINCLVYYFL